MAGSQDDIIIVLMGLTGVGKSNFINVAIGKNATLVGDNLKSETSKIRTFRHKEPGYDKPIVFVDTPGFNNTNLPDTAILQMIGDWLKKTYDENKRLTGIIYLYRVSDNRVSGSVVKNFTMFQKLCGEEAARKVILVSTMWSLVKPEVGKMRAKRVQEEFWKDMIHGGLNNDAFHNDKASAWRIIKQIMGTEVVVKLERELAILRLPLSETEAGMALYDSLQKELYKYKETVQKLWEQAKKEGNQEDAKRLEEDYQEAKKKLDSTFEQLKMMKIPWSRKILKLLHLI